MIFIARKYGQLGNRLLLFAHWIAFAHEHGVAVCNPAFDEYAHYFEGTRGNPLSKFPRPRRPFPSPRVVRLACYSAARITLRLPLSRCGIGHVDCPDGTWYWLDAPANLAHVLVAPLTLATGFAFRHEDLLNRHGTVVRNFLRPAEPFRSNIERIVASARTGCDVLVGVHIRRGDFRTWMGGQWCFDDETYGRWMRETTALYPGRRVGFLVVSDEPVSPASFPDLTIFNGTRHLVEDMYALAGCDRIIGAFCSTFADWASFYGDIPIAAMRDADARIDSASFAHRAGQRP